MQRLLLGDCLELLKTVETGSVDMVLADLPYGTTACKWDTCIPFEPLWEQLHRVTKPNAAMCMFGSEPFSSKMRMSNLKRFKYDWIWNKVVSGSFVQSARMPLRVHEYISIFNTAKNHPKYIPQMIDCGRHRVGGPTQEKNNKAIPIKNFDISLKKKVYDKKFPISIITENTRKDKARGLHPTLKPVALLEYLIKTYTNEGDTVLDPTMGSGSTGVACKNLGRKFVGIEMDDKYFEIAKKRIDDSSRLL